MLKRLIYILSLSITVLALGFTIAEDPIQEIIQKLNKFTDQYPQEKIHLQIDKPFYIAGEDIWIKSYLITAKENKPSSLSKIVYIELIDPNNEIGSKLTLVVDSGKAFGNLSIPDSFASGNYRLRAYTNYMRNFDEDFFFEKFITIKDISEKEAPSKKAEIKNSIDVQFFPEGGNLVYRIRSKIGFKVLNELGVGVNASGYIINNEKQKVAIFSTAHAGMGSFALTPFANQNYKAVIENPDGTNYIFNLPQILDSGYSLAINAIDDKNISIKITISNDLIKGQDISLLAQNNGASFYSTTTKADQAIITATIPKRRFPTGIIQFTLFASSSPVAERIIFINHNDQLKIKFSKPKIPLKNLNLSSLNLLVTDYNENPLDGNFSVSITELDKVPYNENDEVSILSNFLLTSDLKGFIEQPNYYFNPNNPDREKHLDNLLLTQGWRRFVWKDLLTNKNSMLTYPIQQSLEIAGQVTDLKNNPSAKAKIVLMSTTAGYNMVLDTIADNYGNFAFDRLEMPDSVNFIIQAKTSNGGKEVKIKLNQAQSVKAKSYIGNVTNMEKYLINAKQQNQNSANNTDGIKLKQVDILKKKELKPVVNVVGSKSRNGSADYVVSKDRIEHESGSAFNIFNSVPGVKMQAGKIIRSMTNTVSMSQSLGGVPQPMLIILDGAQVDQEVLQTTPASAVEGIEVLVSNYNTLIYDDGYWGVILVTTKSGATNSVSKNNAFKNSNVARIFNPGFSTVKEFYIPKSDDQNLNYKTPENSQLNSIVYWNPNLNSDIRGKANINFLTSKNTKYRIIIEGMDSFGNLGRTVYTYETLQ